MFGHFVEYVECTGKVSTLRMHCNEGIGDGSRGGVDIALGEEGMELAAFEMSI